MAVQAFRRSGCAEAALTLRLHGLQPSARYEITNFDVAGTTIAAGRTLMKEALTLPIHDRPGAAIVIYRTVK